MPLHKKFAVAFFALAGMWTFPNQSEAGPLLDWLRGRKTNNVVYRQQRTLHQATPGTFTQAPTNLQPGQCQRTCMQNYQRVVVNYVPYTAYRTNWQRVPVTQYRPVTNQDPRTGCVVTCMKPCVNYSWQLQRTPYTTYRPVYRTQNYRVPVTTISNDCSTGTCGVPAAAQNVGLANGCNSCGVPNGNFAPFQPGAVQPGSTFPGAIQPGIIPGNGTRTPADNPPTLGFQNGGSRRVSYRRPLPENFSTYSGTQNQTHLGYNNQLHGTVYGTPEYQPSASGQSAPVPANRTFAPTPAPTQGSGSAADQVPMIRDDEPATTTPRSVLKTPTSNPIQDPSPEKRWNLQAKHTPGSPFVTLASNPAVVKPWGYRPVTTENAFGNTEDSFQGNSDKTEMNSSWSSF